MGPHRLGTKRNCFPPRISYEAFSRGSLRVRHQSLTDFHHTTLIVISGTLLQGDTILKQYAAYLPTAVLLLTTLANAATPAIAAFWMNHASAAAIFAPLAVIVAHWLPSPYDRVRPN
jgi:hypothetical protein